MNLVSTPGGNKGWLGYRRESAGVAHNPKSVMAVEEANLYLGYGDTPAL